MHCRLLIAWLILAAWTARYAPAREPVDYVRQIKPIFDAHCVKCHGPQESESGLRLDSPAGPLTGGTSGPAIVPGKSAESLLVHAIAHSGDATPMPPEDEGEPLDAAQVALVKAWIDEGAKVSAEIVAAASPKPETPQPEAEKNVRSRHWSLQPIGHPAPPRLRRSTWARNAIDRFVLARLEKQGIAPSPDADRATLLRRVSLDLTGLPPTRGELEAFLSDPSADAYEKAVDRLLASPRYGERFARHWLDLARYADSNGFTIDSARSMWKYRDWVISAFNRDLPFDQFVIEQMAGDLLPGATTDQMIASGFHRNTLVNEEGGADPEQFRIEAVVDRINTTGTVFLGLTVGCAQCHSHKFDPISHKEYYQLLAFFNNCDEPTLSLPTAEQTTEIAAAGREIAAVESKLVPAEAEIRSGQAAWEKRLANALPVRWVALADVESRSREGATLKPLDDGSLLASGSLPNRDVYEIKGRAPEKMTAVRLEVLTHDSLPNRGPGRGFDGDLALSEIVLAAGGGSAGTSANLTPIKFVRALADETAAESAVDFAIDGKASTAWIPPTGVALANLDHWAYFVTESDVPSSAAVQLLLEQKREMMRGTIGRVRISVSSASREVLALRESSRRLLLKAADERSKAEAAQLRIEYLKSHPTYGPIYAEIERLKARQQKATSSAPTAMVMQERAARRETHVHVRGDFLRRGVLVQPGVPAVLPALATAGTTATRLDLAKWLVEGSNPLTARVTVNRFWQHFFGVGLVETENDFGTQGSPPSHPELLDWLAARFISDGWSMKSLHRLIVTSSTYRQSSHARADLAQVDPRNRLLARQSRIRLDAESIRDVGLAASGLLSAKVGGPSVFPPQPKGFYRFTQNEKHWKDSQGEDRYRRGLYTWFWRSIPDPFLITFDAPTGNVTCTRRNRSNTPLQALSLANDRLIFEISQGLAGRVLRDGGSDDLARIGYATELCLARKPSDKEQQVLLHFLRGQTTDFDKNQADAAAVAPPALPAGISEAQAAAWTALARVLVNLDEFITRE